MRALGAVTVAASLVLAAACSGDTGDQPDVGPASDAVEQAVASFTDADTGRFTFQVGEDTDALIRTTGAYAMAADQLSWQMTLSNGRRSVVTDLVRLDDRAWLRVGRRGAAPRGCWEPVAARQAGVRTGTQFEPRGGQPALPHAAVVTAAEGTAWVSEGSVVEATTDLYSLAATLGEVVGELDLTAESLDARADVTMLLEDGDVVAWRTDLVAVLEALSEAGVALTQDMQALVETGAEIQVATGFHALGNEMAIAGPDRGDVCRDGR